MSEQARPKAVTTGIVTAAFQAALMLLSALWNPIAGIPAAVLFAAAGVGLHKGRAWSGYGAALLLAASFVGVSLALLLHAEGDVGWGSLAAAGVLNALFALLFIRAGKALTPGTGARGLWITAAAAVFLFPLVFRPFVLPTSSMEPTLLIGDHILVSPFGGSSPQRGALVVHRYPVDPAQTFVKRVVAVGGDRIHFINKKLFVNGQEQQEPYATHLTQYVDVFRDNFPQDPNVALPGDNWAETLTKNTQNGELLVPQGKYFVLGDNRDSSLDSRYWGFLDQKDIVGTPVIVYLSVEQGLGGLPQPPLFHPSRVRWSRMLKIL